MTPAQLKKWRAAYPELDVNDHALESWPDCASLYGNDYVVYLETKGNEAAPFVRSMLRELVWTYGNWTKAQRDGDATRLLQDMLNAVANGPPEYDFARRFITDYARANNIPLMPVTPATQAFDFDALPIVAPPPQPAAETSP